MSEAPNSTSHKSIRGTTLSYVAGFVLSISLTVIAYYLVVSKSVAGTKLISTILGLAILQMFIQIFFFLHLGRGPKPLYNVLFFFGTASIILVVISGSIFIMNNLHYNMQPTEVTTKLAQDEAIAQIGDIKTGACQEIHNNHKVTIKNGEVSPVHTQALLCDSLTFINEDDKIRDMTFGSHPSHENYGGESELTVRKGHPKTLTLNQVGEYTFHDHLNPETEGDFKVTQQGL